MSYASLEEIEAKQGFLTIYDLLAHIESRIAECRKEPQKVIERLRQTAKPNADSYSKNAVRVPDKTNTDPDLLAHINGLEASRSNIVNFIEQDNEYRKQVPNPYYLQNGYRSPYPSSTCYRCNKGLMQQVKSKQLPELRHVPRLPGGLCITRYYKCETCGNFDSSWPLWR